MNFLFYSMRHISQMNYASNLALMCYQYKYINKTTVLGPIM